MNHLSTMATPQAETVYWDLPETVQEINAQPLPTLLHNGRRGWRTRRLGDRVSVPSPALNRPIGALTLWILPREDFATSVARQWMIEREPRHQVHVLLGDRADDQARADHRLHHFALLYSRDWYQQLQAKWHHGPTYPEGDANSMFLQGGEKAFIGLGHLNLQRGHWMQIGLSWNEPDNDYRMYVNGVLVQTATKTVNHPLLREASSGVLFAGHPMFGYGELAFFNRPLDAREFGLLYESAKPAGNETIDASLRQTHTGSALSPFDWKPGEGWEQTLDLPLNRPGDLDRFYVQGMTAAPTVTEEGLRVRTSEVRRFQLVEPPDWDRDEQWDPTQVYLWLEDFFEGDFAVEYEFKPLQNHGLSLLVTRAAGLHGENFLDHEPRRISGSMQTLCWDNVRNYHWEYYRQMEDARNDTASHVLVKNPYLRPLCYQAAPDRLSVGEWHRLQFVHEGNLLRGAVDGVQVIAAEDRPFGGFGPVLRNGTLAIRCMWGSDILFRNLRVWTKPDVF